jgi:hypothetical protein
MKATTFFFFFWEQLKQHHCIKKWTKKNPNKNQWPKPSHGRQKLDTRQQGGEGDPAPKEPQNLVHKSNHFL